MKENTIDRISFKLRRKKTGHWLSGQYGNSYSIVSKYIKLTEINLDIITLNDIVHIP